MNNINSIHFLKYPNRDSFKNDKSDKKCIKKLSSYCDAYEKFIETFQLFSEKPSLEDATLILSELKDVKKLRDKFKKSSLISLLPLSFKQSLPEHDLAFQKMEGKISQVLMECEVKIDAEKSSEACYLAAKELEINLDLAAVMKEESLLFAYIDILKQIYALYQNSYTLGNVDAATDMERTAVTCRLFREFYEKFLKSWQFTYLFKLFVGPDVPFPLSFSDPRLQSLFKFCLQIPNIKGIPEKSHSFIYAFMKVPLDSPLGHVILQMAVEIISSDSFQKGKEDNEYLDEYRCDKLDYLTDLANQSSELHVLPQIEEVPAKLSVNKSMGKHVRLKLLRYAHNIGINLNQRIEWQVDQWMAEFREELLGASFQDYYGSLKANNPVEAEGYLCRREAKNLGLIFDHQNDTPFDHSRVEIKHLNTTSMNVNAHLHDVKSFFDEKKNKVTEKAMIDYLLIAANAPKVMKDFAGRLQDHMKGQPKGYFDESNPQKLTEQGARALLYALGYLSQK